MYGSLFEKADAVVVFGGSNRAYFTETETSFGCVLLTPDTKTFYTDFRYALVAEKNAAGAYEVVVTSPEKLDGLLADKLASLGAKSVGYEEDVLTVARFQELQKGIAGFTM